MPTHEGEASGTSLPLHLLPEGGTSLIPLFPPKWCWYDVRNILKIQFFYFFITVKIAGGNERGFQNGALNVSKFNYPKGIVLDPNDNCLCISDLANHCIRTINDDGI